jgi:hypothetical protein
MTAKSALGVAVGSTHSSLVLAEPTLMWTYLSVVERETYVRNRSSSSWNISLSSDWGWPRVWRQIWYGRNASSGKL